MISLLKSSDIIKMKLKVEKTVQNTIRQHDLIQSGDAIVLGLSGGPDSSCLFDVLYNMKEKMNLLIQPVHVNHKIRPGAAERDQKFVERLCRSKGIECASFEVNCVALAGKLGMTTEEAGRKARYDAFYDTAKSLKESTGRRVRIAVAQNADDQAETVLFRLIRGTGTDGLAGIAYEREEKRAGGSFSIIRPLLDVPREDIEEYCDEHRLKTVRDHTNDEAVYARNKIRLELLPLLEGEYNPNIRGALVRLAGIAASDREYIEGRVREEYCKALYEPADGIGTITFDREKLAAMHPAIRHRVVMRAFGRMGLTSDVTEERLEAADRIINVKQAPKTVEFPHGHKLAVASGRVIIS